MVGHRCGDCWPLQVPCAAFRERLAAEHAAHAPRVNVSSQTPLLGQPHAIGHAALVKPMVVFGEGKDDVGKTEAGNIVEILLKMLRISDPEITHTPLSARRIEYRRHAAVAQKPTHRSSPGKRIPMTVLSSGC